MWSTSVFVVRGWVTLYNGATVYAEACLGAQPPHIKLVEYPQHTPPSRDSSSQWCLCMLMTRLFFTHNIKGHILLSCLLKLFPYPLAPPPILSRIFGEKMWPLLVVMVYDATRNTFQIV